MLTFTYAGQTIILKSVRKIRSLHVYMHVHDFCMV
jgi:hypothetical protein